MTRIVSAHERKKEMSKKYKDNWVDGDGDNLRYFGVFMMLSLLVKFWFVDEKWNVFHYKRIVEITFAIKSSFLNGTIFW